MFLFIQGNIYKKLLYYLDFKNETFNRFIFNNAFENNFHK